MVGGPEPVRLPTTDVNGWGLQPRYRTHEAESRRPRHHDGDHGDTGADGADGGGDGGAGSRGERCHHGPDDNCWRDNCHAIRDREEPGHLNRQA